ncbi:ketopantoate reductase family protein [Paenibacillus sp. Soil522]|uniref:ketopantoate reductase family protein n=1 Tax=Paenibacillus sp. Soil522 TaxID=1736388 RepID=UPI0006FD4177|nr:2-dehydropantoate 2-reductase [Paenibacillus sp. Soil522]KRE41702.1 2-dehydropantoate 2-reductase [Paenibacillus sp. Soil522]
MIIGVIGAGAVGGYCGAMLKRAGHDVIFVARGKHLDAMKEQGLLIHCDSGSFRVDGHFTNDVQDLNQADLILFTVSSTDTRATAEKLLPLLKADSMILTLQNGVDNEEMLTEWFGKARVFSGAAYLNVSLEAPGVIRQQQLQSFMIGSLAEEAGKEQAEMIVHLFQQAGLECQISMCILEEKWNKLIINAVFNPISALNSVTVGEILDNEKLRKTAERSLAEAVKIGTALGIPIRQELIDRFFIIAESARHHKTSMLQHREQGKKMEIESLCGYLVHKGRALGIDTSVLSSTYQALLLYEGNDENEIS